MNRASLLLLLLALLAPTTAPAGNIVTIDSRTAKVLDESAEEACRLSRRTKVEAIEFVEDSDLLKVKLSIKGCPEEGYIQKKYLRGNFQGLPTNAIDANEKPPKDTVGCEIPSPREEPLETILELADKVEDAAQANPGRSFTQLVKKWNTNSDSRKLVQIPTTGTFANFGPCGSHHYNGEEPRPPGVDSYVTPFTGCMITALMQEWRRTACPKRSGCTLQWGDASHGNKEKFPPHSTHRDGTCIDFRPMRKGEFEDSPITHRSANYDRETTRKLVSTLREMGATKIIFNDPKVDTDRRRKHDNHLHVCFEPNEISEKTCKNLRVEETLCPDLP